MCECLQRSEEEGVGSREQPDVGAREHVYTRSKRVSPPDA